MALVGLRLPSDPHLRRWMLFVDGENFTIRAQRFAKENDITLDVGEYYEPDVFVWFPDVKATQALTNTQNTPMQVQPHAIRSYFYTSLVGDEPRLTDIRERLHALGFDPQVFKKGRKDQKTKGVDIALAKDLLSNAYRDNFDVAALIAGDGDYVPLVTEVKRLGKVVHLIFFCGAAYGLSPELRLASDRYFEMADFFRDAWRKQLTPDAEATAPPNAE